MKPAAGPEGPPARTRAAANPARHAATAAAPSAQADEAAQTRARLLRTALALFAEQGFAPTSIRQIAAAAQVNVAAVSYYFGDKAGLYAAVFRGAPDPAGDLPPEGIDTLEALYDRFLAPFRQGDLVRLWIKLYRREMLEPTGLWKARVEQNMRPMHAAVVALLCRQLGLQQADDEVHRLAITVVGLAVHLFIGCDVIELLAPQLAAGPDRLDEWRARLVGYAQALIDAEKLRRKQAAGARRRAGTPLHRPTTGKSA
ncbi:MAG: CerR family C-terminal domain-containing protein [Burkholderiales bacterium]|nr:CerR family C-terminal domain-containing protein [Burkholderiales bacterium]MDE2276336.1 CerR family C-terminal domain-containing protein [Burkholderiales bacterium]